MSECTHNCSTCENKCGEYKKEDFIKPLNQYSSIKNVIAVMSGKGGVGKSFVTSSLAVKLMKEGYKVGILDADITGPSIPKLFNVHGPVESSADAIYPAVSKNGIRIMSSNLLLQNESDPVIWRGPVIAGLVQQFWTDVAWGELDYLLIDMPPGTGDVPLTVFQSFPVDGIVVVTTPQDLVKMIVEKAYKMANKMEIKILGLVENMSYFECPNCSEKFEVFGPSKVEEVALEYGIDTTAKIPLNGVHASLSDMGLIENLEFDYLNRVVNKIKNIQK